MKIIFASFFVLSFLLSACAPSVLPPTATLTPFPTAALTPTLIPTLTPTATPIAVDGVAEVEGVLYAYDQQTQNWVALPSLPEGTIKAKVENGVIGAYGADGYLLYTLNGVEWEKAQPRYEYMSYNAQFDVELRQMVEGGAFPEDLSTVERMYYEDGTEVPFGVIQTYNEGGRTFYVISGVMGKGWINTTPEDRIAGTYQSPLIMVPITDGSRVVLTPSSLNQEVPENVAFLPGLVAKEEWKSEGRWLAESTAAKVLAFLQRQTREGGQLVGRQVIFTISDKKSMKGFAEYNRNLWELLKFLRGESGGDLKWDANSIFDYVIWSLPEVQDRP